MKYETQKVKSQYKTARIAAEKAKQEAANLKMQLSARKSPKASLDLADDPVSRQI